MRDFRDKLALVTGAGSGIGRETALALAREGARVVLCDVNQEALDATAEAAAAAGTCFLAQRADVASRVDMAALAEAVHAQAPALDILVNNAGVGMAANFLDVSLDDWDWILGINLKGVVHGCHFFLPKMIARGGGGHVVNVSSMLGYWAASDVSAYATTKHAVLGFSECLREELRPHGIGVSTICPGVIHTNIVRTSRFAGAQLDEAARARVEAAYAKRAYGPERVAQGILRAIRKNRGVAPVSPEAWFAYVLERLSTRLSRAASRYVARKMMQ